MKLIKFNDIETENLQIKDVANAGFDLIITTSDGADFRIEDGLTELVTNRASINLANGSSLDYKSLIEKFLINENNLKTLDINFVGDADKSISADKEGTGVKEGVIDQLSLALDEIIDSENVSNEESTKEDVDEVKEKLKAALLKAQTEAKALAEALAKEKEKEEEKEGEEEEAPEVEAEEDNEAKEEDKKHVEEMKNELRIEKVEKNDNKSNLVGDYDVPPMPPSSSSSGKFPTEGEPKEEELYEFKVSLKGETDSGAKGDFITNVAEPIFTGTGTPSTIVTITIGGSDYSATVDGEGKWSIPPIPQLEEGEFEYSAKDTAGNKITGILVIDQTNTLTHDLQNDTGSSDSDNITQDARLVFVGKTDAGSSVVIKINGKEYKTTANADGDYTITVKDALVDGIYDYEIISTDIAGNQVSQTNKVTVDTKIEGTVSLSSEQDTGSSDSDEITQTNENIIIAGTLESGAVAFLTFNGNKYPVQIQDDGSWSVMISGVLPDGNYPYSLSVTDIAGNTEIIKGEVVVDTTTYVNGGLDKESDTGESNSDNLTLDNKPLFSGEGEPKSTITLFINNKEYTSTVNKDGVWAIEVTDALPDGDHEYTAVLTDVAGNSQQISDTIRIDTGVSVTAKLDTDTGLSSSDGITKEKNNIISGQTEAGATGVISINGEKPIKLNMEANGSFSFETGELPDGNYKYKITVTDLAGNESTLNQSFTVDTTTFVTGGLDSASDTGISDSDKITNNSTPTFKGKAEPLSSIIVTIDNNEYATNVDANGSWSVTTTKPLTDGKYTVNISVTDIAGNINSITEEITIDLTNPTSFVANLINDSGIDNSDLITKNGKLSFSGSVEVGCSITIIINGRSYSSADGVTISPDGSWSFELAEALNDNIYPIEFIATDAAGNITKLEKEITVDTVTEISGGLSTKDDTGVNNNDGITNNNKPSISGLAEANSSIVVTVNDINYETTTDKNGKWDVTLNELSDGTYDVSMTVTDKAGNVASTTDVITIDTVIPVESTIQLKNDTGSSGRDFITKDNIPSLQGVAEVNASVQIVVVFDNGEKYSYKEPDVIINPLTGEWSFLSPIAFPDGHHKLQIISTDKAGNSSVKEQFIEIDTDIKMTSSLDTASDSGSFNDDKLTNITTPKFKGTGTAGDKISININGNTYTSVVDENGTWEVQVTDALNHRPNQPYEYTVTATDVAGNSISKTDYVTVDTATSVAGGLDITSDSAAVDKITSVKTPKFSGTGEVGASIELEIDFKTYTTTVDSKGNWVIQIESDMADGLYQYTVTATDLAGNKNDFTNNVTIDTVNSVSGGLDAGSDSASIDGITKHNNPFFSGKGEVGARITVTINAQEYSAIVGSDKTWKIQVTDKLIDDHYSYKITSIDVAGNKAELPESQITIDTTTFVTGGLALGHDTGINSNDKITKHDSPQFSGTGEVGGTITLTIDSKNYSAKVGDNGLWVITDVHSLSDGDYNYSIKITDIAGNSTTITESVTIDTTPPAFVPAILEDDTGSSSKDMITKNGDLVFVGSVENSSVQIEVSINGNVYRSPDQITVLEDGSWRFECPETLPETEAGYNFVITYTDIAGNPITQTGKVVVDTSNTISGGLDDSSDSGIIGDKLTKETKPAFSGKTEPNSKITLVIDNEEYYAQANRNGEWFIKTGHNLKDGVFKYTITSEDVAGNKQSIEDTIEIDTKPSPLTDITLDNDSNVAGDWVTRNATPQWSGKLEAGSELTIEVSGNGISTTLRSPDNFIVDDNGRWSATLGESLKEGTYTVKFTAVDAAGNISSINHDILIDTSIAITASMDSISDSGISDSDNITSNKLPSFSGTGEVGAEVTVSILGKEYKVTVGENGTWKIALTTPLDDGNYAVEISIVDLAGNYMKAPDINIEIDTTAPIISSITMTSDTGVSNSDGLTKESSPVFAGKTEAGSSVAMTINGITHEIPSSSIDEEGNWIFTWPLSLYDGDYQWSVLVTDVAGNKNTETGDITIDTQNTLTGQMTESSDSGTSSSDNLTNNRTPSFNGKTDPLSSVKIVLSNGTEYSTKADENGNWSLSITDKLDNGVFNYNIISVDPAGNEKTITQSFEVDFSEPTISISLINDTGTSTSDGITKSRMPVFSGKTEEGCSVQIIVNGITYSQPTVTVGGDGSWSFVSPVSLVDGDYVITVKSTDKAGNVGSEDLNITIDNTVYIDGGLSEGTDSGSSNSDSITNSRNPVFEGKGEAGATVSLKIAEFTYTTTVLPTESWSVEITDLINDGSYPVEITITDIAGNEKTITENITIDRTANISGGLDSLSDTGVSNSDLITSQNKPKFSGTSEEGAIVTLTINGTSKEVLVGSNNQWNVQWEHVIPDGEVLISISVVDVAGNEKTITQNITIDTEKPEIPTVTLDNDTGHSSSDNITKEDRPQFSGKVNDGESIIFIIDNKTYRSPDDIAIADNGEWLFRVPLNFDDGTYEYTVIVTDLAGNQNEVTASVEVDTSFLMTVVLLDEDDSGIKGDFITSTTTPTLNGVAEENAKISISINNRIYETVATSDNRWEFTFPESLPHGIYNYTIIGTDVAGNTVTKEGVLQIDTETELHGGLDNSSNSNLTSDLITNSEEIKFSGTGERKSSLTITIGGKTYTAEVDEYGRWEFIVPVRLDEGSYKYTIVSTDIAGNTAKIEDTITIDRTNFIEVALKEGSDTGASTVDGITKNNRPEFTGKTQAGTTLTLVVNDTTNYTIKVNADGSFEFKFPSALLDGDYTYTFTSIDIAGNKSEHTNSLVIDTVSEAGGQLDTGSDSGISSSDNLTNDKTPTFSGFGETGSTVVLTINNVEYVVDINASNKWEITIPAENALTDNTYPYTISITDVAGNEKLISETIVIDTSTTVTASMITDTGHSNSDGITSEKCPTFKGTLEANAVITITINNKTYTLDNGIELESDGNWTLTIPETDALSDGNYDWSVVSVDKAGNKDSVTGHVVIDTTDPTLLTVDLTNGSVDDTSISKNNIPEFGGRSEIGTAIKVFINGTEQLSSSIVINSDGSWTFVSPNTLDDGDYIVKVTSTDDAGNEQSKTHNLEIDTNTTISGSLDSTTDTGESSSDKITKSEYLKFSGTGEHNATVTVKIGDLVYTTLVGEDGNWAITFTDIIPEGNYSYTISSVDKAGNKADVSDNLTVDRTNLISIILNEDSDSGTSNADGITKETQPTFSGKTQPNTTVTLKLADGISYDIPLNADGTFEFKIPEALADGTYNYEINSVDVAGNIVTDKGTLVVDTTCEATGGLDEVSDTGITNDSKTNSKTPIFSGIGEAGSSVILTINNIDHSATVGEDNTWQIEIKQEHELSDNTYPYSIVITDVAGNEKTISGEIEVDSSTTVTATMISDTGESNSDGITQSQRPSFSGQLEVGSTIIITVGTHKYGVDDGIVINSDGSWTFTIPEIHSLSDGSYNWSVDVVDEAGNKDKVEGVVVVDTTSPNELTVDLLNGSVSDTSISKNSTPVLGGNSEAGSTIIVKINDVTQPSSTITTNPDGTWSFLAASSLVDGDYIFTIISIDAAGNQQEDTHILEIDSSTTVTGGLAPESDSGSSSSDNITNSKNIVFKGTGETGSQIVLTINNTEFKTTVDNEGNWAITVGELDGTDNIKYDYKIVATDKAGNVDTIQGKHINVDTTDPIKPTFTLDDISDSATKDDWITKSENISISGIAEAGTKLTIKIGSATYNLTVDSTGTWVYDFKDLEEGSHVVSVTSTDIAGNVNTQSQTITVDRSISLEGGLSSNSTNDTGESTTDGYTSVKRPEIKGTTDPDASIKVVLSGAGGVKIEIDTIADKDGNWKIVAEDYPSDLNDGTYSYDVTTTDTAGNTTSFNDSLTIDTQITNTVSLSNTTNSGSLSDTITNVNKPRFEGNGQTNDKIEVSIKDNSGAVLTTLSTTVGANGKWFVTAIDTLPDGSYTIDVVATDKAGNSTSSETTVTIDTVKPMRLSGGLDAGSNTGDKEDTITKDDTPKFSGKVENGCSIQLVFTNGTTYDAVVDVNGNWNYQVTESIPDGIYNYKIIATDIAGNTSEIDREMTIDRTIQFSGDLAEGSDTGWATSDWHTNQNRPTFEGTTDAFSTVTVKLNTVPPKTHSVTAGEDGKYSLNLGDLFGDGSVIADGSYSLTFTAIDPAGNESTFNKSLVIDTERPTGLSLELAETSDSANKGDFITNNNTPVIKGNCESGDVKLVVKIKGKADQQVTVADDGTWEYAIPELIDGTYSITIVATDKAGNSTSLKQDLVIDTKIPTGITGALSSDSDEGASSSDGITNIDTRLKFEGTTEEKSSVVLVINNKEYIATVDSRGGWSVIIPDHFNDGSYSAVIKVTDQAGNVNENTVIDFTVDTVAPIISAIKLRPADDTGETDDNMTNVKNPTIIGNVSTDTARLWITVSGSSKVFEGVIDSNGKFTCRLNGLGDGTYNYTVHATDVAGNTSEETGNTIIIDTRNFVEAELSAESDSGSSSTDGITNKINPIIEGTTDIGNTLKLTVKDRNGAVVFTDEKQAKGAEFNFEIKTKLKEGDHTWVIVSVDTAGNSTEAEGEFTIDLNSTLSGGLHAASDTGIIGDNITNTPNPILTGTAESQSTITIKVTGSFGGQYAEKTYVTTASTSGSWSQTITDGLSNGEYNYSITAVDKAGNTSDAVDGKIQVDQLPPTVTGNIKTDSGVDSMDKITNGVSEGSKKGHLDFYGTSGDGAVKVVLMIGGRTYNITPAPNGSWEFIVPERLPDNLYSYTIYAEDVAGNKTPNVVGQVTLDTKISTIASLNQESDSGVQGDSITNNTKPIISGSGEAGLDMSASIVVGGTTISLGNLKSNSDGAWSLNLAPYLASPLSDGAYTITFNASDKAGNNGNFTYRFSIDTTPPVVSLNKYNSSEVTSDKPKISGTAEKGATVTLVVDGESFSTKVASNGSWVFATAEMPSFNDGEVEYYVYAIDVAGNRSDNSYDIITINTGTYVEGGLEEGSDTGSLSTDGITQNRTPTFSGAGETEGEITVTIKNANGTIFRTYTAIVGRNGLWEIVVPSDEPIPDGHYSYTVSIKDSTGNIATTEERDLQIDNSVHIETIRAWEGSWGGSLQGGVWYLGQKSNQINGKLTNGEKGAEIKIVINGREYIGVTDKNGNFAVTLNLPDGDYTAAVTVTDMAGNKTNTSLNINVDTTAQWTVGVNDEVTGHASNWIVDKDRPTFSGTCDPRNASSVQIQLFGETNLTFHGVISSGTWTINPNSNIPDGTYSYRIIIFEKSGRWTEQRGTIIIDTINEVISLNDIDKEVDASGAWTSTNISGFGEPHAKISLLFNNVEYFATVGAGGRWNINLPVTENGIYNITLKSTDRAGNVATLPDKTVTIDFIENLSFNTTEGEVFNPSTSPLTGKGDAGMSLTFKIIDENGKIYTKYASVDVNGNWILDLSDLPDGNYSITATGTTNWGEAEISTTVNIDTTPPAIESITLDSDTGIVGDGITSTPTPTFSGKVEAGSARVTISIGGVTYESGTHFTLNADGTWTFTVPVSLPDGDYSYTVTAYDEVGNNATESGNIVIQASKPIISDILIEDGKVTDGGLITNKEQPDLSGKVDGNTIKLTITIGDLVLESGVDFVILPNGKWSIQLPASIGEGSHSITIVATNSAGVVSENVVNFVIDLTPPEGSGSLDADLNGNGNDGYIDNANPIFTGIGESGSTIIVTINNKSYSAPVDVNGEWSLEIPDTLPDGKYLYVIEIMDPAGNKSQIDYDMLYIDTLDPVINSVTLDTNTGSPDDTITSVNRPTFSGKTSEGVSLVIFSIGGVDYKSGVDFMLQTNGSWSFTVPVTLTDDTYNFTVSVFDKAGNQATFNDSVTIDTATSVANNIGIIGSVDVDGVITSNSDQPTLTGNVEAGVIKASININSETFISGEDFFILPDGSWQMILPPNLSEGINKVTIVTETISGVKAETSVIFNKDTLEPVGAGGLNDEINNVIEDNVISNSRPAFSGTGEAGSTVIVYIGANEYKTIVNNLGHWDVQAPTDLADDNYAYTIDMIDRAGNVATAIISGALVIDTSNITPSEPEITITEKVITDLTIDEDHQTITGKAEFGDIVTLHISDSNITIDDMADSDGNWSLNIPNLDHGTHTYFIDVLSSAGDLMTTQEGNINIIDSAIINTSNTEVIESADELVLTGIADINSEVVLIINDQEITTQTNENGDWEYNIDVATNDVVVKSIINGLDSTEVIDTTTPTATTSNEIHAASVIGNSIDSEAQIDDVLF